MLNSSTKQVRAHIETGWRGEEMFGTVCYLAAFCLYLESQSMSVLLSIIYSVYSFWLRLFSPCEYDMDFL